MIQVYNMNPNCCLKNDSFPIKCRCCYRGYGYCDHIKCYDFKYCCVNYYFVNFQDRHFDNTSSKIFSSLKQLDKCISDIKNKKSDFSSFKNIFKTMENELFKIPIITIKTWSIPDYYHDIHIYFCEIYHKYNVDRIYMKGLMSYFDTHMEFLLCINQLGIEDNILFEPYLFTHVILSYLLFNKEIEYMKRPNIKRIYRQHIGYMKKLRMKKEDTFFGILF